MLSTILVISMAHASKLTANYSIHAQNFEDRLVDKLVDHLVLRGRVVLRAHLVRKVNPIPARKHLWKITRESRKRSQDQKNKVKAISAKAKRTQKNRQQQMQSIEAKEKSGSGAYPLTWAEVKASPKKQVPRKCSREVVLDTETTGLFPEIHGKLSERMVEFAATELIDGEQTGRNLHLYINPGKPVPQAAFRVHGLDWDFLKQFPDFPKVADKILAFIGKDSIVAHNGGFDLRFLNAELKHAKQPQIDPSRLTDTLRIARRLHPKQDGQKVSNTLDALCERYQISNQERLTTGLHSAKGDTELLLEAYKHMKKLAESNHVDITDLIAARTPGHQADQGVQVEKEEGKQKAERRQVATKKIARPRTKRKRRPR